MSESRKLLFQSHQPTAMQTNRLQLHALIFASFLLHGLGLPAQAATQMMFFEQARATICGLNLVNPPLYSGNLGAVTPPSSDWDGSWKFKTLTGGMIFTSGKAYTIEFADGQWARIIVGVSGGKTVRTSAMFRSGSGVMTPFAPPPVAGNSYVIREVMTVAQVFGPLAPSLNHGLSAATADSVEMPNGQKFFYDGSTWRRGSAVNQGGMPIYFVQGFIFHRLPGTSLTVTLNGDVKTTPTWMKLHHPLVKRPYSMLQPNFSLLSTVTSTTRPTVSNLLTLGTSGLYRGYNPISNPNAAGINVDTDGSSTSEKVLIPQSNGSYLNCYFFDDGAGNSGWFTESGDPAEDIELPCAVYYQRSRSKVFIKWNP